MREVEQFAQNLIKEAGEVLRKNFKKDASLLRIRGQSKEVVTKYDKLIDKFFIERISKQFPSHSLFTEESGWLKRNSDWLWIVDSLDGSSNFAAGNPLFSVCVALIRKEELVMGAVYAPVLNELYFAKKGQGAFLNGKRIKVSNVAKLKQSYLVYCDGNEKNRKRVAKIINKLYPLVKDIRKIGSAGLETSWLAAGRVDGYFTTKIDPWDAAAGVLLVQEAGGRVSDFKGRAWQPVQNDLLFTNKKLHSQALKTLAG